jgi:hypothetical protein
MDFCPLSLFSVPPISSSNFLLFPNSLSATETISLQSATEEVGMKKGAVTFSVLLLSSPTLHLFLLLPLFPDLAAGHQPASSPRQRQKEKPATNRTSSKKQYAVF